MTRMNSREGRWVDVLQSNVIHSGNFNCCSLAEYDIVVF